MSAIAHRAIRVSRGVNWLVERACVALHDFFSEDGVTAAERAEV